MGESVGKLAKTGSPGRIVAEENFICWLVLFVVAFIK